MYVYRLLGLLENFLSTVKWLEHNVTYVARYIEMDLRYITWIDHDRGASFFSNVSECYSNFSLSTNGYSATVLASKQETLQIPRDLATRHSYEISHLKRLAIGK